ncbi:MAG: EamA family transporter [Candidatus Binatia bacterium]
MGPQFLALCTALSYAAANISVRRGLHYSSAATATLISLMVHTIVLGSAVVLTGGVPKVAAMAIGLIAITGVLQTGMRLWHYTGIEKVGTSRAVTLRSTYPIFSVVIGVTILQEQVTTEILIGTFLVVTGIITTSWKVERQISTFRWWHLLFPMVTALITGIVHPIRRYAMVIADEPLFFAAIVGVISLFCFTSTLTFPSMRERIVWNPNALMPFIAAGVFETSAVLLMLNAFVTGPVVLVSPIAATSPIWTLLMSVVFLRDLEGINRYAVVGTLCVVIGVIAIYLA